MMKTHNSNPDLRIALFTAALFTLGTMARSADTPTLKEAFQDHFQVGTAVNRAITTGRGFRRTLEQVNQDIALVQAQFNHLVAENEMKWALIHPREGADGYDFGPADAFVNFGLSNQMHLAGHTLVWHAQTPNWVFAGTNPPPATTSTTSPPPTTPTTAAANAPGTDRFGPGQAGRGFGGGFGRAGYDGPRASREELLERMRNHIHTVVGRYQGKIKVWDVVNEAIADQGDQRAAQLAVAADHRAGLHRQGLRIRPRGRSRRHPPLQRLRIGEPGQTPQAGDVDQVLAGAKGAGHGDRDAGPSQCFQRQL